MMTQTKVDVAPVPHAEPDDYESAMAELERLVVQLEGGQLPLDQLMSGYQRGVVLLSYCRQRLQAVEQQIRVAEDGGFKPWVSQDD